MHRLIEGLTNYSRSGVNREAFRSCNLNEIATEVLEALRTDLEDRNAKVELGPLPEAVWGDHTLLSEALQNLICNALKFHRPGSDPHVAIGSREDGPGWIIYVRDNGIGIAPEHSDRIFRMFERINCDSDYPGAGIGLAVTKRIIEGHGGRIWMESVPGQGTTFYFFLSGTPALAA